MLRKTIILLCCVMTFANADAQTSPLRFSEFYSLPFYKNNLKVGGLVTVASMATVGVGGPAIAIGVSSLSSSMAGSGAGASYMRSIGGDETLGAAILNALSIGAELNFAKALSSSTVLVLKSVQASGMGAMLLNNKSAVKLQIIPSDIVGSQTIQESLKRFNELQEQFVAEKISAQELDAVVQTEADKLVAYLDQTRQREDVVAGAVLLFDMGRYQDFNRYLHNTEIRSDQESYLLYLKAVSSLLQNDFEMAEILILKSIHSEPQAIEPKMLYLMILEDLGKHYKILNKLWVDVLLESFDKNHYSTPNSLTSAYNMAGDLAEVHQDYKTALYYHAKAFDQIGLLSARDDKAILCMKIALHHKRLQDPDAARQYFDKSLMYVSDARLRQQIEEAFNQP